jgi:hypothetical protein
MFTVGAPELSGEWLAGALYILLTVGLEFYPPFAAWWDEVQHKRMIVATVGLVAVAALIGLHYAGAFGLEIGEFGWPVIGQGIEVWLAFLGGDWAVWSALQGTYPRKRKRKRQAAPEPEPEEPQEVAETGSWHDGAG